jgi:CBS-domain-containing membrane protein
MAAATAAAILIVLLILKATGLFMPPAGAMAILAMLIPEEAMARYVPAVAVGSTVFMLTAVAWNVTHHTGTENCA